MVTLHFHTSVTAGCGFFAHAVAACIVTESEGFGAAGHAHVRDLVVHVLGDGLDVFAIEAEI